MNEVDSRERERESGRTKKKEPASEDQKRLSLASSDETKAEREGSESSWRPKGRLSLALSTVAAAVPKLPFIFDADIDQVAKSEYKFRACLPASSFVSFGLLFDHGQQICSRDESEGGEGSRQLPRSK